MQEKTAQSAPVTMTGALPGTSVTGEDSVKRKLVQLQLGLLIHAEECQKREQAGFVGEKPAAKRRCSDCTLRHCSTFKRVWEHMPHCRAGKTCPSKLQLVHSIQGDREPFMGNRLWRAGQTNATYIFLLTYFFHLCVSVIHHPSFLYEICLYSSVLCDIPKDSWPLADLYQIPLSNLSPAKACLHSTDFQVLRYNYNQRKKTTNWKETTALQESWCIFTREKCSSVWSALMTEECFLTRNNEIMFFG